MRLSTVVPTVVVAVVVSCCMSAAFAQGARKPPDPDKVFARKDADGDGKITRDEFKAGMKEDDVSFVAVGGPNTAYGALVSKQVDFLMMFEPAGAMCIVLKTCKVVWRAGTDREPADIFATNGGGNGLVFTQEYIDRNPHVIDAVIRAMREADAFINDPKNFDETLKIAQQYFRFDMPKGDEVLATAMKIANDTNTYRAGIDRKAIQKNLDLLLETKQIEKATPIQDLILDRAPTP